MQVIGRPEAERRMLAKFARPDFLGDLHALLPSSMSGDLDETARLSAFLRVFKDVIERIPGQRWARTHEVARQLGIPQIMESNQ